MARLALISSNDRLASPIFSVSFLRTGRAEALHLALQVLSARIEPDKVLGCELAWEVHVHGYWSQVRRSNGTGYESEETYSERSFA